MPPPWLNPAMTAQADHRPRVPGTGPMSGFDAGAVDKAFFADQPSVRTNFISTLGHGDLVVMGGSFAPAMGLPPVGGHNPLEPARLGKPIVTGPDASNWTRVTEALARAGGLSIAEAPSRLPTVIAPLLASSDAARAMGERARRAAAEANGGLDILWGRLAAMLPPRGGGR